MASFLLAVSGTTAEAGTGDAKVGREIALRWCAECHQVVPQGVARDVAPAFPAMANDPAYTEPRLRGWLADPHPPMPKLQLSNREIENLIAYLQSLKSN